MISNFLVGRLRTIASFVPQSCVMADIGCDHGLLSVGLSQHCSKVWAIDVSALAIQGARELVLDAGVSGRVHVELGDGLMPLINKNRKCDTVVIAGMGTNRILQILTNDNTTDLYGDFEKRVTHSNPLQHSYSTLSTPLPVYYDYTRPRSCDFSNLNQIGISRIITQPWPPNILPMHALHSALLDNGWYMDDQKIDRAGNLHYITTCFLRQQQREDNGREKENHLKENNEKNLKYLSDSEVFNLSPLVVRSLAGTATIKEKTLFEEYITKQRGTLLIKVKGMERRRKNIMISDNSDDISGDKSRHTAKGKGKSKYGPLNERRTAMYKSSLGKSELCHIVRTSSVSSNEKDLERHIDARENSLYSIRDYTNNNDNFNDINRYKNRNKGENSLSDDNGNSSIFQKRLNDINGDINKNSNDNNNNNSNNNNNNNDIDDNKNIKKDIDARLAEVIENIISKILIKQ